MIVLIKQCLCFVKMSQLWRNEGRKVVVHIEVFYMWINIGYIAPEPEVPRVLMRLLGKTSLYRSWL